MSVWADPYYRSEPLFQVTRYLTLESLNHKNVLDLCDFDVEEYGHFPVPAPAGNFKENILAKKTTVKALACKFATERDYSFELMFQSLKNVKFGMEAVYKLTAAIARRKLTFKMEYNYDNLLPFARQLFNAFGPASYSSPTTWEDWSKAAFTNWDDTMEFPYFFQQAEAIRHLLVAQGMHSYRAHVAKAKRRDKPYPFLDWKTILAPQNKDVKVTRFKSLTIIVFKNASYLLLNKDIKRLSQLLDSIGRTYFYVHNYADARNITSKAMTVGLRDIYSMLFTSFENNNKKECYSICRSMDIGEYILLAEAAGPIAQQSLDAQKKKGFDGWYDKVFPLAQYVGVLRRFRIKEALELSSVRKILPPPDFCIYSAMYNNYQMHYSPFEQIPSAMPDVNLDDFSRYWDWSMIRNFYDRHKRCPGKIRSKVRRKDWHTLYPNIAPISIPYQEVGDIDWEGTFSYQDYQFAEQELRKDKTMAPKRLSRDMTADELNELPITERNQIANFFLNPNCKTLPEIRREITEDNESFDYVSLVALKPEAKKEGGRLFYMANDAQRIAMSEKEANISEYLRCKAGNASGISDIELARRTEEISSWGDPTAKKVYISFDLEKWSPRQNPWLKRTAYEKWSKAFGQPHINKLLKVQTGARLAFIKMGIHHEYINPGQDLEGYDAKTNTAMHIEVMSYAINVCRRKKLLQKGAKLLAFVDDGAMSLDFPKDANPDEIWNVIKTIESIYQMVGLRISWDKTFISDSLLVFLNNVYYRGFIVTPGMKAFLKIAKPVDAPALTIMDELEALAAGCQGALKAGASYRVTYSMYIWEAVKAYLRWGRFKVEFSDNHIIMAMLPVQLGGIPLRSLPQISTNESVNPFTSAIGNIKAFAHFYKGSAPYINEILNQRMLAMKSKTFLSNPQLIQADTQCLNAGRFASTMQKFLHREAKNPFVRSVLDASISDNVQIFADAVKSMPAVHSAALTQMWNMTPDAVIQTFIRKFERSQTAASLLGFRTTLRIAIANRFQAAQVISNYDSKVKFRVLKT